MSDFFNKTEQKIELTYEDLDEPIIFYLRPILVDIRAYMSEVSSR